jgi:hypothetical protein
MYARIAVFEQRDPAAVSELRRIAETRAADWEQETGAMAFYALADPVAGKGYGLTLFEDEPALRAAEPVFERMAKEVPEKVRGKRTSVLVQEVVAHEVRDGAHAVRISVLKGSPTSSEESLTEAIDHLLPELRMVDGWKGFIACIDRSTGATTAFTLWESRSALQASEQEADKLRRRFAEDTKEQIVAVDRCELVFGHDRAPRLVTS